MVQLMTNRENSLLVLKKHILISNYLAQLLMAMQSILPSAVVCHGNRRYHLGAEQRSQQ